MLKTNNYKILAALNLYGKQKKKNLVASKGGSKTESETCLYDSFRPFVLVSINFVPLFLWGLSTFFLSFFYSCSLIFFSTFFYLYFFSSQFFHFRFFISA